MAEVEPCMMELLVQIGLRLFKVQIVDLILALYCRNVGLFIGNGRRNECRNHLALHHSDGVDHSIFNEQVV